MTILVILTSLACVFGASSWADQDFSSGPVIKPGCQSKLPVLCIIYTQAKHVTFIALGTG